MANTCWVELEVTPNNLDFSSDISFKGQHWMFTIRGDKVTLASDKVHIDRDLSSQDYDNDGRKENQIIGHARNIINFVFDIDVKWGYRSCGGALLSNIYPSIHQQTNDEHSSKTFNDKAIKMDKVVFESIAKSRKKGINSMLNYWRRGFELDQLGYDAESFLNYFKVLECLSEVGKERAEHKQIWERFTVKQSGKKKPIPKPSLKKYTFNQIYMVAAILAGAGYDKNVNRGNVLYLLKVLSIRNNWNVGHKIFRNNPYDTYDGIGQHSMEFSHVMIENIYIEKIAKYFILRYVRPGKYKLENPHGMPIITLK